MVEGAIQFQTTHLQLFATSAVLRITSILSKDMEIDDDLEDRFEASNSYSRGEGVGSSSKKSVHRISDIDPIDEQDLRIALENIELKHEQEIDSLVDGYKSSYEKWLFELRCGFGLLMYGFGSKKALLEDFASNMLTDYSVIVVNGYVQSINLRQVVITLVELWLEQAGRSPKAQKSLNLCSVDELLSFLDGSENDETDSFLCIVVHNIDGPGLRDEDNQQCLARVAACHHVRLVASIDHVNAPILWDKKMVHMQFNWWWHHVPTYAPYTVEGSFFPLILANCPATQTAKTAAIVLQSLTPNAQSVFRVLAEYQLSHQDEPGMAMDSLFATCRERFLVSSKVTLNSHLTEFKDHQLILTKKHSEGHNCLYIPLASDTLEKLLSDIS